MQSFVQAFGPLSLRLLFEIELQATGVEFNCMQIRDCLKPFIGSKKINQEGDWHSNFFLRPWRISCAWTKQSQGWFWGVTAKLVMMTSRPGGDRMKETGGVSFRVNVQAVCWRIKSWFKLLVRYPSIRSCLKFGICCFDTSHPRVIGLTLCFHLFQAFADALSINKTITTLDLTRNKIGDNGMKVWWVKRCGASRGSCVRVDGSGLMEVMGSQRIWSEFAWLSLEPFQDLDGFSRLLDSLQHVMKTLFLNMEAVIVLWEEQSLWEGHAGWIELFWREFLQNQTTLSSVWGEIRNFVLGQIPQCLTHGRAGYVEAVAWNAGDTWIHWRYAL